MSTRMQHPQPDSATVLTFSDAPDTTPDPPQPTPPAPDERALDITFLKAAA